MSRPANKLPPIDKNEPELPHPSTYIRGKTWRVKPLKDWLRHHYAKGTPNRLMAKLLKSDAKRVQNFISRLNRENELPKKGTPTQSWLDEVDERILEISRTGIDPRQTKHALEPRPAVNTPDKSEDWTPNMDRRPGALSVDAEPEVLNPQTVVQEVGAPEETDTTQEPSTDLVKKVTQGEDGTEVLRLAIASRALLQWNRSLMRRVDREVAEEIHEHCEQYADQINEFLPKIDKVQLALRVLELDEESASALVDLLTEMV